MTILVLGSGGREHALGVRLSKDETVKTVYVLPGNPGMDGDEKIISLPSIDLFNYNSVLKAAEDLKPNLIIIGPEKPLVEGLTDLLEANGFMVFGPSKKAAEIEGSKIFSKSIMNKYAIPTALSKNYYDYDTVIKALSTWDFNKGIVIKSDSLAAGKGVVVTHSRQEAEKTIFDFMKNPKCKVKTEKLLIEEKLTGKELSSFALCDGKTFQIIGNICDYKTLKEKGKGPNTGGMGCCRPVNWPSKKILETIKTKVFEPLLKGMEKEGIPYKGVLFAGLMINKEEVKVIEFNARFGDPEAQVLLPLLEGNLSSSLLAAAKGDLKNTKPLNLSTKQGVHIVLSSKGYPNLDDTPMDLGHVINFPEKLILDRQKKDPNFLFLSGVSKNTNGQLVNTGGRVLGLSAFAGTLKQARIQAYKAIKEITFFGAYYRKDIGEEFDQ